jgi:hypothetical protein
MRDSEPRLTRDHYCTVAYFPAMLVSIPVRGDDDLELVVTDFSAGLPTGSDVPRVECRRRDDRTAFPSADIFVRARTLETERGQHRNRADFLHGLPRLRIVATRHAAHAPPARAVSVIEGRAAA